MTKKLLIKRISAIYLAIVLVAGTITLFSPSFMTGAQAQEYYGGMENNYENHYGKDTYKSKDSNSSVNVKKIKCNNINVNVNGLELNTTSVPFLSNLLASEAQASGEGERGASSYGSGHSGSDGDFKFVCINNNNNTVVVEEEPLIPPVVDECAEAEDIETCFEENLLPGDFLSLTAALGNGIDVIIERESVTLNSFADICEALDGLTFAQVEDVIRQILSEAGINVFNINLVPCIAEALGIPVPPA